MTKITKTSNTKTSKKVSVDTPVVDTVVEQVTTEQVTTETKVTKRELTDKIWEEINSEGYKLPEGKQLRGHFIDRAIAEASMTPAGAATYYQGYRNVAAGKPRYYVAKKNQPVQASLPLVVVD